MSSAGTRMFSHQRIPLLRKQVAIVAVRIVKVVTTATVEYKYKNTKTDKKHEQNAHTHT